MIEICLPRSTEMSAAIEAAGINPNPPAIKIVVNRVGLDTGSIGLKKAQETMGREIFWQMPNDYKTMVEVRNNGVPLIEQAPKAAITQSVIELAEYFTSGATPDKDAAEGDDAKASKGSRWRNLFSKK
jgi:pilus assembly protein CpaE